MPLDWLVHYWEAKAELTLPFLAGRATAMQLVFGEKVIYRRHEKDGGFVYIASREELLHWARQHCYSFHPHLQDGSLHFALDAENRTADFPRIDRRHEAMPFPLVQAAAGEMAAVLADLAVPFLLKFSGNRGFHFLWGFDRVEVEQASGGDIWGFERGIIRFLRARLEECLQASGRRADFYRVLREGDPITITNSADRECTRGQPQGLPLQLPALPLVRTPGERPGLPAPGAGRAGGLPAPRRDPRGRSTDYADSTDRT